MASFQRIQERIEAVQFLRFDGQTPIFSEALAWVDEVLAAPEVANMFMRKVDGYLGLWTRAAYQFANPGDWVVRVDGSHLFISNDRAFRGLYEAAQ